MALRLTDIGGQYCLNVLFGATVKPTTFTLQLITDSTATTDADIQGTHTVAAGGGYADKTLANDATVALNGGIPEAVWAAQTWTFTGPLTGNPKIYGYQILSGTTLIFDEMFTEGMTPSNNGDKLVMTPKIRLGNGTPT